jgi:hypothetical protein
MSQQPPGSSVYVPYGTPIPHGKQQAGTTVFGIIAIVIGALSGCLGLFIPLARLAPQPAGAPPRSEGLFVGFIVYVAVALGCIWWGTGAIRKRRWVRPLALIAGSMVLFWGVVGIPFMAVVMSAVMPDAMANNPSHTPFPAAFWVGFLVGVIGFGAVFFVILPGAFLLFFKSKDVKGMLEYADPVPRWTDRCPTPALGVVVGLLFHCVGMAMLIRFAVFPIFGLFLLLNAVINSVCIDNSKLISAYGYVARDSAARETASKMMQHMGTLGTLAMSVPWPFAQVCYILVVRRYFTRRAET